MADKSKMYRVYSIVPRAKQEDFWLNIGVAFPHDDGQGYNIILQALPIHGEGKIVMRVYDPDKDDGKLPIDSKSAALAPKK